MSGTRESDHPSLDLLADLRAGEGSDPAALEHLEGCAQCQAALSPLVEVGSLLRQAAIVPPSELEWARMLQKARATPATPSAVAAAIRQPFSWRLVAAAALVAALIPATLAWLLPPCQASTTTGDMLIVASADDPGI